MWRWTLSRITRVCEDVLHMFHCEFTVCWLFRLSLCELDSDSDPPSAPTVCHTEHGPSNSSVPQRPESLSHRSVLCVTCIPQCISKLSRRSFSCLLIFSNSLTAVLKWSDRSVTQSEAAEVLSLEVISSSWLMLSVSPAVFPVSAPSDCLCRSSHTFFISSSSPQWLNNLQEFLHFSPSSLQSCKLIYLYQDLLMWLFRAKTDY